jgi:hypothetical protein
VALPVPDHDETIADTLTLTRRDRDEGEEGTRRGRPARHPRRGGRGHRTKVTRSALQHAASVAGLLLTTGAMIAELPKDDAPAMPGGGMPDMGGMM